MHEDNGLSVQRPLAVHISKQGFIETSCHGHIVFTFNGDFLFVCFKLKDFCGLFGPYSVLYPFTYPLKPSNSQCLKS